MIPSNENPLGYHFYEGGGFPDSYQGALFKTDFRIWLRRQFILDKKSLSDSYKAGILIKLCYQEYPDNISVETLFEGINWFANCGESDRISLLKLSKRMLQDIEAETEDHENDDEKKSPKFSYFWDFKEIWASFYSKFRIDLYKEQLHWWAFYSLLKSLDSESPVGRIIGTRVVDNSKRPPRSVVIAKYLAAIPEVK
jgi:hypothetical protein